jgi:ribosome biogenesis protein BRX1
MGSRGLAGRFRHLMNDIMKMIPHHKKEAKVERKGAKDMVDDLCHERSCNNFMFFEARKHKDLYLWIAKSPSGPSFKLQVQNIHTTDELKLTGNCLMYSRPMLSFDKSFD